MRALLLLAALAVVPAHAASGLFGLFGGDRNGPSRVDGYHFDYQIYGGDKVGLLQVFDDGNQTFFQFRDMDLRKVPAILTEDAGGNKQAVRIEASSPYLVVNDVARKFVLNFGAGKDQKEASVVRVGSDPVRVASRLGAGDALGHDAPTMRRTPAKGAPGEETSANRGRGVESAPRPQTDVAREAIAVAPQRTACVPWVSANAGRTINVPFAADASEPTLQAQEDLRSVAQKLAGSANIVVRGRPSPSGGVVQAQKRAEAIKALLVRAGISESRITTATDGKSKAASMGGVHFSEIVYGAPSSGFVALDGC